MASLYWKWDKVIPPNICNAFLESLKSEDWQESKVSGSTGRELSWRNNYVQFLDNNHWLEGVLYNHVRYANKSAQWNYEINEISPVQISKYENNEYYNWHQDCSILVPIDTLPIGQQRKLSVVLQLNDPSEYTGGGLELEDEFNNPLGSNLLLNQGDLIVFPSFINHRAIEVIEGTRYSATGWVSGPNFK
jgi:PKHD-type hydroxylase